MTLTIQMLGTGSAFAKKYDNNNAIVRSGDYTLLVDCGITAPRALHELGIKPDELDGILITHLHGDHVGGLEEIAFRMRYVHNRKPVLWVPSDLRFPLWDNTLKGCMENRGEQATELDDYFDVRVIEPRGLIQLSPLLSVEILPTVHIPGKPCYSLILNGKTFYSSDTQFNPDLIERAYRENGCTLLLHECQLHSPGAVHTTLDELLRLPEDIQSKILLMHYGDDMEQFIGKTGRMSFMEQRKIYRLD